ncbi:unnamed protein product [Cylindrotheca closterium]|uniref:CHAT domain-containing protein n=1 Tax=Cylindrotheca closterium TaxID=2856 RepID=A0AAD2FPJ5_9STRA|nr:unnamed protein product [Cylindrotheca closterium]
MNFSGHQRMGNGSHHRTATPQGTILEDEEYSFNYDSDGNTVVTDASSIFPGGSNNGRNNTIANNNTNNEWVTKSDLLTIFQAAPLAGMNANGNLSPIGDLLDLQEERTQLASIFKRSNVAVEFQIATHDALGKFLAEDKGRILHFSCHGDAGFLFLEDDWGGLAPLANDNLQRWIQLGGRELQFVFVSACNSQSIGQAFVDAGVPHVVCCKENAKLRAGVSALFEKTFYRNLARKKTVQESFDIAKEATLANPKIPEEYRREEVEKYRLLGTGGRGGGGNNNNKQNVNNHNVSVFFQRNINVSQRRAVVGGAEGFPPPPKIFIGRTIDQYRILKLLQHARTVCVHGPSGMGKTALVKAVCQYVHYRLNMMDFTDIQWIDTSQARLSHRTEEHLQPLLDLIHRSPEPSPNKFLEEAWEPILQLVETFQHRKTLLVVDAKHISNQDALQKLGIFIDEFINATRHVKVIVIYNDEDGIQTSNLKMEHQCYSVEPLSFEWSARLFSRLCPEGLLKEKYYGIETSRQLCEVLIPSSETNMDANNNMNTVTPRQQMLWDMVGGGDPRRTVNVAKTFTRQQFQDLLLLSANKDDNDLTLEKLLQLDCKIEEIEKRRDIYERQCNKQYIEMCRGMLNELERRRETYSRASLERRQKQLLTEIETAKNERKFAKALELQHKQEQLERIKEQLPTLIWLENRREELEFEIELAKNKDFLQAENLYKELKRTIASIEAERNSFGDTDIPESRALLEAQIIKMEEELNNVVASRNFSKARELKPEIHRLKEMRSMVPSAEDFRSRIMSLDASLQQAIDEHDFDSAETLYNRLEEIKAKLRTEEEAEKSYGIQVPGDSTPMSIQSVRSSVARRAAADPGDDQSVGSSVARRTAIDPGDDPITSSVHSTTSYDPPGLTLRTESRRSDPMQEGKKGAGNRLSDSNFSLRAPARNALQTIIPSGAHENPSAPCVHESVVAERHSNHDRRSHQESRRPDPSNSISIVEPGAYAVRGNTSGSDGDNEHDVTSTYSAEEGVPASPIAQSAVVERDITLPPIMATSTPLPSAMEIVNDVMNDQERLEQQIFQIMKKHAVQAEVVPAPERHNSRDISVDFSEYSTGSRDTESLRDSLDTEGKKGGMKTIFKKLRNRTGKK